MQRRQLLKDTALLATMAPLRRWIDTAIFERLNKIGLQLSTITATLSQDFEGTLAKVSDIGFDQVEFSAMGLLGRDPQEVKDLLATNKLDAPVGRVAFDVPEDFMSMPRDQQMKIIGSQGSLENLKSRIQKSVGECQVLGQDLLIIPAIMPHAFSDMAQFTKTVSVLKEMGKQCKDQGLTLGYHNHNWEFDKLDGLIPYFYMLDELDPEIFTFQLDTYWVRKANQDLHEILEKHAGRFVTCHLKDIDGEGGFEDVGHGEINFAEFIKAAQKQGAKYFFVERDTSPDPMQSIQRSYDYLDALEF